MNPSIQLSGKFHNFIYCWALCINCLNQQHLSDCEVVVAEVVVLVVVLTVVFSEHRTLLVGGCMHKGQSQDYRLSEADSLSAVLHHFDVHGRHSLKDAAASGRNPSNDWSVCPPLPRWICKELAQPCTPDYRQQPRHSTSHSSFFTLLSLSTRRHLFGSAAMARCSNPLPNLHIFPLVFV